MRFLADENFSIVPIEGHRNLGHEVLWARDILPAAPDRKLFEFAVANGLIILTHDKDFGELAQALTNDSRAGIVLFRPRASTLDRATSLILNTLQSRSDWSGHLSVVDDHRIRMRKIG